jgi:hypothetical protein
MDDRFLNELRRDPDPQFARELRSRLQAQGLPTVMRALRPAPALAFGIVAAVVVALFAFPSVRASAQAMLDLFRVRHFAAVQFDDSRLSKLKSLESDKALMVFDQQETLVDPGPPRRFDSLDEAAAAAGIQARRATDLPRGMSADTITVVGAGAMRMSVSDAKLRALLDALDLRDVSVPAGLDGKMVEVRKPPMLIQQYHGGGWRAGLVQSQSPEVSVPAGVDVERLAEIGLRVLGLDAGEARRVAASTDWRSTLMVPVPLNASTFRQVTVHGQQGLLITTTSSANASGERRREGTMVLWTEGDYVYGLVGNLQPDDVLQMAESVR